MSPQKNRELTNYITEGNVATLFVLERYCLKESKPYDINIWKYNAKNKEAILLRPTTYRIFIVNLSKDIDTIGEQNQHLFIELLDECTGILVIKLYTWYLHIDAYENDRLKDLEANLNVEFSSCNQRKGMILVESSDLAEKYNILAYNTGSEFATEGDALNIYFGNIDELGTKEIMMKCRISFVCLKEILDTTIVVAEKFGPFEGFIEIDLKSADEKRILIESKELDKAKLEKYISYAKEYTEKLIPNSDNGTILVSRILKGTETFKLFKECGNIAIGDQNNADTFTTSVNSAHKHEFIKSDIMATSKECKFGISKLPTVFVAVINETIGTILIMGEDEDLTLLKNTLTMNKQTAFESYIIYPEKFNDTAQPRQRKIHFSSIDLDNNMPVLPHHLRLLFTINPADDTKEINDDI